MSTVAYKSWDEVKGNLNGNETLRDALEAVVRNATRPKKSGGDRCFACLEYTYGELVVKKGQFNLPRLLSGKPAKEALFKHLGLKMTHGGAPISPRIPLGFVAKSNGKQSHGILEASFSIERNVGSGSGSRWEKLGYPKKEELPQALLRPGSMFGLFEYFDFYRKLGEPPAYDVSAGCRSPFIVANFGATGLLGKLRAQFDGCTLEKDTLEKFKSGEISLSDFIQKLLPKECAEYRTEIVLVPFRLIGDGKEASVREFLRIALEQAWDQSAHLRNGFIEMLNTKDFIRKWLGNSEIPSDYFEPMARFIYGVEWVIQNQIPGYRINHDGNCGICDGQECCGGPFSELVSGLDVIFANRRPHSRCLLLFPEYFSACPKGSAVYVPSRLNRPGRKWGNRVDFVEKVNEAFNLAKTNRINEATPLSQAELLFDEKTGKKLTLEDFGIKSQMTLKTKLGDDMNRACAPHLRHWFFSDGFARIQKS